MMCLHPRSIALQTMLISLPLASLVTAQDPCTVRAYDGTNENGVGAAVGFVLEYCTEVTVPDVCLDRGAYFINAVEFQATQTGGDTTMPFTAQVRRTPTGLQGPTPPGEIVAGPTQDTAEGVPGFPSSQSWVTTVLDSVGSFSVGFAAVELNSACIVVDGNATVDQFIAADQTPATPIVPCWTGQVPGMPDEDCRKAGFPNLNALAAGLQVSPHAALGDGSQQVPPNGTTAVAVVRGGPEKAGGTDFWFEVVHDVANPTAAHIHNAPPGSNGGIVVNFGDPTSPIQATGVDMSGLLNELLAGDLYVNVHSAAFPAGEVRGQIEPAGAQIFADGFESGDTTAWSNSVP